MPTHASATVTDILLKTIRQRPGHAFSLKRLAERLKLDPESLARAIAELQAWGYRVKRSSETLTFVAAPDRLSGVEIGYKLKTKTLGQTIFAYKSVKSTNDVARELAEAGAAEGTLVVSEEQTKGRGRFKRTWFSPPETGIYLSLILRPKFPPEKAPAISVVTALALAEAISKWLPQRVMIKWPNDILLGRKKSGQVRKTAGILTELVAEKGKIDFVIVGVGINVNQTAPDFPDAIRKQATSIRRVLRKKLTRVELLQRFLLSFEERYRDYSKSGLKPLNNRLRRLSYLIGREVSIGTGREVITGLATDIDTLGRLIVKTAQGTIPINAGEVTVLKK